MSKFLLAAALSLGLGAAPAIASSESRLIFKAPIGEQQASKSKRFAINSELGRAWVEIDVWHNPSETGEMHRVQVPGLSYDKAKAQVVFTANGQSVVCAKVQESGVLIFKHQRIEPTGDCELTRRYVQVPVDNGFNVEVLEHFEVYLNTSQPGRPVSSDSGASG